VDSTQNIISFCTGYGGIELGLRRAGVDVRVVCNVEIEAFVQANLVAKIEEGRMDNAPIWTDLKTFPARIFRGKICGVIGGYPCQPFSSAGKRKGEEDPRHLWPYIRQHIRAIRPLWCFFENVRGHTTMGLWRVLSDLEEDGYRTEWGLFSAEETGAPHQRIRVFILAYRGGFGSTPGISEQIKGQEGQSEDFNHDSGGQLVNPASEGLEGCARESVQGRSEGLTSTNGEELGNPPSERPHRGSENCEGEQSEVLGAGLESDGELADSNRHGKERDEPADREGAWTKQGGKDELAHPASWEPRQSQTRNGGQDIGGGSEETRWPARPGEEQYDWEEPRVVADSKVKRCGGRKDKDGENGEGLSEQEGEERSILRSETEGCSGDGETTNDEAQSELGGTTNGSACGVDAIANRVDRLRLLGNGVVSECAEIAWRNLWQRI
jgi:DNA (cytosine-5)-methyltransferase 1